MDYPYPETETVIENGACIGNVVSILFQHKLITQENNNPTKKRGLAALWNDRCLEKLISIAKESKYDTVLFSSEGISALHPDKLRKVLNRFNAEFNTEFILFVRDPYDYSYSAWRQLLKVAYLQLPFESFLKRRLARQSFGMFNALHIAKDYPELKLINYDFYKKSLANAFFDNVGIDLQVEERTTSEEVIHNRSLSPSESELMLVTNQHFEGTFFPVLLRHRLLARKNFTPLNKKHFSKEADKMLTDYFRENFSQLNSRIVGSPIRLDYLSQESTTRQIEPQDVEVLLETFHHFVAKRKQRQPLKNKIKHFYKVITIRRVPFDFDPYAYLELNSDVSASGLDPYFHYSRNGYREGRPYRYY